MRTRSSFGQRTLSGEHLTSPEVFRTERERIFSGSWLLAGHVSEVAEPGSYLLFELDRDNVVVLRDGDGGLRAFHNVCRHRGSRLCVEPRGRLGKVIRCPYHAWSYGLDGALRAAPNMSDVHGFERGDYALAPVAVEEWQGLVFVNLAAEPVPFSEALPGLDGRFAGWGLAELRSAHRTDYEIAANWKLLFHNYSECYHCPVAHPHLNRLTPFRNSANDLVDGPVLGGPMWMSDREGSMTVGGRPCAPRLPRLGADQLGRVFYYTVFPTAFLSFHPDYVLVHRLQALAVERTRIVCDWYFHPDAIAAPGFDPAPAVEFWDLTNRQDWELVENAQRGVASSAWVPGPYSELESQLAAFDRHYLGALGAGKPAARRRA